MKATPVNEGKLSIRLYYYFYHLLNEEVNKMKNEEREEGCLMSEPDQEEMKATILVNARVV